MSLGAYRRATTRMLGFAHSSIAAVTYRRKGKHDYIVLGLHLPSLRHKDLATSSKSYSFFSRELRFYLDPLELENSDSN